MVEEGVEENVIKTTTSNKKGGKEMVIPIDQRRKQLIQMTRLSLMLPTFRLLG